MRITMTRGRIDWIMVSGPTHAYGKDNVVVMTSAGTMWPAHAVAGQWINLAPGFEGNVIDSVVCYKSDAHMYSLIVQTYADYKALSDGNGDVSADVRRD